MDAALARMTSRPILQGAVDFYDDRRWRPADAIAAVLMGVPVIATGIFWYLWFIRPRPGRRGAVPVAAMTALRFLQEKAGTRGRP
jgi:hypothetical protein